MLSGNQLRVRVVRNKVIPNYLPIDEPVWQTAAHQLLELFKEANGRTRGELDEDLQNFTTAGPDQLIWQGLAKLLDDRCEYEIASDFPPAQIRDTAFRIAATQRKPGSHFDREIVIKNTAEALSLSLEQVEVGLFADLKDEQRVIKFDSCSVDQLLKRYNVALAQGVLIRSTGLEAVVWGETQTRYRELFRAAKFHRLIGQIKTGPKDSYHMQFDGPLSLFSSTQKYGLQLALFLPSLMLCKNYELKATVRWGAQRKEKEFHLTSRDGIESHKPDFGQYRPVELDAFEKSFREKAEDWVIDSEPTPIFIGDEIWVPDYRIKNKLTKKEIDLEILGYWRKVSVARQLKLLREHRPKQFLLVVGDLYKADEDEETLNADAEIVRFKRTPNVAEVLKAADRM
jgi:uncharacterized protein